jgi:heme-degrading monooxygenase HmoA
MSLHADFQPYYAVIFTSVLHAETPGYSEMAALMEALARKQSGFLGFESARSESGISVSYWKTPEDIRQWKLQSDHLIAQQTGIQQWYQYYKVRVCKVEREYEYVASETQR